MGAIPALELSVLALRPLVGEITIVVLFILLIVWQLGKPSTHREEKQPKPIKDTSKAKLPAISRVKTLERLSTEAAAATPHFVNSEAISSTQTPAAAATAAPAAAAVEATALGVGDRAVKDSAAVRKCAASLETDFGVDRSIALRFSRARQGDLSKARQFLKADLEWRSEKRPELITQHGCYTALSSGCWRFLGTTATGIPVVFIHLGLWDPSQYSVDEYERYICYFLEHCCRAGERFVVLFDLEGWKLSHGFHMRKVARLLSTLQDHYPERLEKALLLRAPGLFLRAWKVIKGFLDPNTATKVVFVNGDLKSEQTELQACNTWNLYPHSYGGPSPESLLCPNIPDEPDVPNCPPLKPLTERRGV